MHKLLVQRRGLSQQFDSSHLHRYYLRTTILGHCVRVTPIGTLQSLGVG